MPNLFSTIKENQASRKFTLIRINPSRYVNDDLTSIGGGKYTITMTSFVINKVEENGVELTLVSGTPAIGEYSYDEDTYLLTVYPTSAPSSTNAIVTSYYLFYTGERNRVWYENPEDDTTSLRDWEPKIQTIPTMNTSIENVEQGVFSIKSSSFSIINNENDFEQYLTINDSFYQKPVQIWICLDATDNIQKVYIGKISKINVSDDKINFTIEDNTSSLLFPAYMGDTSDEVYWSQDSFANVNPNNNGAVIPYFIGSASRYQLIADSSISSLSTARRLDIGSLHKAVCVSYTTSIATNTNRTWGICRVGSDGFLNFSFTPSAISNTDPNYTRLTGTFAQIDKFRIGDTFIINQTAVDYYVRVIDIDRTNNYIYTTKEAAISTGAAILANNCPAIVIDNFDGTYYPLYGRDYTAAITTTTGGNKYLQITFTNNFESSLSMATLDPGNMTTYYRIRPDTTNAKHGSVLKLMLENAGLTTLASTFTTANTDLAVNCNISIPSIFESDFGSYVKYIQDILKSTLGYLTINNSFEVEYYLFVAPAGTVTITDTDILENSPRIEIEYRDIVSTIIAYNPNYASDEAIEDVNDTPSKTLSSNKAQYLHGINNTIRFVHSLESINARLPEILNLRSERRATYFFKTKTLNLDSIIGNDFILSRAGILGSEATKNLKVIGIQKTQNDVQLILTDLYNLS